MTTQLYRIRPGLLADIPQSVDVFADALSHDSLFDILFPNRHIHPEAFKAYVTRLFHSRWWSPNFQMTVLVGTDDDVPVGISWWKRPNSQLSFYERWISPFAWISPLVQAFLSFRDWLFPIPNLDRYAANTFKRAFADTEPRILSTPRRKSAFYLSTLGVRPELQGKGLGSMLLQDGLQMVDERGAAAWLIGLEGIDGYYERYGFVQVARANINELEHWRGGSIMLRHE